MVSLSSLHCRPISDGGPINGMTFDCPVCLHSHLIRVKWANPEPGAASVVKTGEAPDFSDLSLERFQYDPGCAFDGQIDHGQVTIYPPAPGAP